MSAAFENFQRVLFISEPEPFGLLNAKGDDAGRGVVPRPAVRGLPVEVISDSSIAPFRPVRIVEWWAAIVAGRDIAVGESPVRSRCF